MLTELSTWTKAWREAMEEMHRVTDTTYWNRRAVDYNDFIQNSEFAYGEAITKLLAEHGSLKPSTEVIEIGAGVGAVTLPLARHAARVTAFEPAASMTDHLAENLQKSGTDNVEIRCEAFDVDTPCEPNSCDLILMCHATWHFPDLLSIIKKMETTSRGYCCLADTAGQTDPNTEKIHHKLGLPTSAGLDRMPFIFNQLYLSGRQPQLTYLPWRMRRSISSAIAMFTLVLNKYRVAEDADLMLIQDHVESLSKDGMYEMPSVMSVFTWPTDNQTMHDTLNGKGRV